MSKYNEIRKELGKHDGLKSNGNKIIGHDRVLDHVAKALINEKDTGKLKEVIEWCKTNSPPKGLGYSLYENGELKNDWWLDKMKEDLK